MNTLQTSSNLSLHGVNAPLEAVDTCKLLHCPRFLKHGAHGKIGTAGLRQLRPSGCLPGAMASRPRGRRGRSPSPSLLFVPALPTCQVGTQKTQKTGETGTVTETAEIGTAGIAAVEDWTCILRGIPGRRRQFFRKASERQAQPWTRPQGDDLGTKM